MQRPWGPKGLGGGLWGVGRVKDGVERGSQTEPCSLPGAPASALGAVEATGGLRAEEGCDLTWVVTGPP